MRIDDFAGNWHGTCGSSPKSISIVVSDPYLIVDIGCIGGTITATMGYNSFSFSNHLCFSDYIQGSGTLSSDSKTLTLTYSDGFFGTSCAFMK